MARKPNYRFERHERERIKAAKKAARAEAKAAKKVKPEGEAGEGEADEAARKRPRRPKTSGGKVGLGYRRPNRAGQLREARTVLSCLLAQVAAQAQVRLHSLRA